MISCDVSCVGQLEYLTFKWKDWTPLYQQGMIQSPAFYIYYYLSDLAFGNWQETHAGNLKLCWSLVSYVLRLTSDRAEGFRLGPEVCLNVLTPTLQHASS